ncbi:MAG TPA: ATP-binding protein [Polyangiaceae bacterium]|nr:ATP-binding protein [Polyangiaceae bacterium]
MALRAAAREQALSDAWAATSFPRERQGFLLTCAFGALVPAWFVFDLLLEPGLVRTFLWLRLVDGVFTAISFAAIARTRDLRVVRGFGAFAIWVTGAVIAFMCTRVSLAHYFPYVLGFSLVFWCNGTLHTWPLRYSVAVWAAMLGTYFLESRLLGIPRPFGDEVAALFYLGSTAIICTAVAENRRRLHHRAFLADHELGARNRDLDETVRSLRETQTRLVEGEKLSALGRLIASLSHEIHNPVNVLRNNLEPLRTHLHRITTALGVARDGGDFAGVCTERDLGLFVDDSVDAMGTMTKGIRRIQTVHEEMRAFVRGDAPEMQAGDLNEGLRATANMFRRLLPPGISIDVACGPLPPTSFQPGQMNQVFFNLIQNAVDAIEGAGQPGSIRVRSEADAEGVLVTVEDTGPGVSPWARQHLFEPFFTTKDAGKGTGLGLATSFQIVSRHAGRIELDDTCLSGARFVVRLPR